MTIHLNIGSNIGHRRSAIERAVAALCVAFPGGRTLCSEPMESAPWGYESPHPFLNAGVLIELDAPMEPAEVWRRVQQAERSVSAMPHRHPGGAYRDREVDIDLIAIDELVTATPALTLPHPRMHLREFVLRPMLALAPGWRHPLLGLTVAEMLACLAEKH